MSREFSAGRVQLLRFDLPGFLILVSAIESVELRSNHNFPRIGIQIPFVGLRGGRPSSNASFVSFTSATNNRKRLQVQAFFDVQNDPIVKEALKEPVAFLGGVFAGILRLDLNEEPLREWVAKTAEAAGVRPEDPEADSSDDLPNEIAIE